MDVNDGNPAATWWCWTENEPSTFRCRERGHDVRALTPGTPVGIGERAARQSTSAQLRETQETLRQVSEKAATLRANLDSANRSRDLAQADLADAQRELAEVQQALKDTLDDLLATRRALLASQADLTRVERERDEALEVRAAAIDAFINLSDQLTEMKRERDLARTELANLRQWQVARNDDTWCALCGQDILRGYAIEPVPADKPDDPHRWAHCLCPPSTPNTPRTDAPGNTEGDLPQ